MSKKTYVNKNIRLTYLSGNRKLTNMNYRFMFISFLAFNEVFDDKEMKKQNRTIGVKHLHRSVMDYIVEPIRMRLDIPRISSQTKKPEFALDQSLC